MAMSSRTRYSLIAFFLFVVVAVVALVWNQRGTEEAPREGSPVSQGDVSPEAEEVEEVTEETPQETMEPAKRIVHVPGSKKSSLDHALDWSVITITFENLPEVSRHALEAALKGDVETAYRLREIREFCRRIPRDEASLEMAVVAIQLRMAQLENQGKPISPEGDDWIIPGMKVFPDLNKTRDEFHRRYESCQALWSVFSPQLRDELFRLAQQGDVMARYIYATWRPDSVLTRDVFASNLNWQFHAFDFSYANLEEGEPVGLLAFGQSYLHGLFTGQFLGLGWGLIKASLDCGLKSELAESQLTMHTGATDSNIFTWGSAISQENSIDISALIALYCH